MENLQTQASVTSTETAPASEVSTQNTPQDIPAEVTQKTEVVPSLSSEVGIKPKAKEESAPAEETQAAGKRPDFNPMINAYLSGSLEDADYAAIEQAGLTREQFTMMAEGIKANQAKNDAELHSWVGGAEQYAELQTFAADHLTDAEIDMYNEALSTGNLKAAKIMVLGLKSMYEQTNGTKPAMRIEADGVSKNIQGYESQQALIKDMNSAKYKNDPEFRASVNARRSKSGF